MAKDQEEKKQLNVETFRKLTLAGLKLRYGSPLPEAIQQRFLWESKSILDNGFEDYYLTAFYFFKFSTNSSVWARGAVSSSVTCYGLHITEIDPLRFGLHSVRFVNNERPMFQFDVEKSRFEEFMQGAEEKLQANATSVDIAHLRDSLLQDVTPMDYLEKRCERDVPVDLDDELACYALRFPRTFDLYETYIRRKAGEAWSPTGIAKLDEILAPTLGILTYQEQMFDVMDTFFKATPIEENEIRLAIQRGEKEKVEEFRSKRVALKEGVTAEEAATVWNILTSNPRAFLKAHAASRVVSRYQFEVKF